jgi:hypothetical protein
MSAGQHRRKGGKEKVEHHKQRGYGGMIKRLADQGLGVATAYNRVAKAKEPRRDKIDATRKQEIEVSRND